MVIDRYILEKKIAVAAKEIFEMVTGRNADECVDSVKEIEEYLENNTRKKTVVRLWR